MKINTNTQVEVKSALIASLMRAHETEAYNKYQNLYYVPIYLPEIEALLEIL